MTYSSRYSGRACLVCWETAISLEDVFRVLAEVKDKRQELNVAVVLIAVIAEGTAYPSLAVREALQNTMPLLGACCEEMFLAIEGSPARQELFRSLFVGSLALLRFHPGKGAQVFGDVHEATARARSVAPHDVLRLQQLGLQRGRGAA